MGESTMCWYAIAGLVAFAVFLVRAMYRYDHCPECGFDYGYCNEDLRYCSHCKSCGRIVSPRTAMESFFWKRS